MNWRNSLTISDRILGSLAYLLPMIDVVNYGRFVFQEIPFLTIIYLPLMPLLKIYRDIPFAGIIIFFLLFLGVVRNPQISHFIRFNTLQAILLSIIISLVGILLQILIPGLGQSLIIQVLMNTLFLGILISSGYGIIKSILGQYPEIPQISDAVRSQIF